jgi:hypothetical protein
MAGRFQLVIGRRDPEPLARFWAAALVAARVWFRVVPEVARQSQEPGTLRQLPQP